MATQRLPTCTWLVDYQEEARVPLVDDEATTINAMASFQKFPPQKKILNFGFSKQEWRCKWPGSPAMPPSIFK